jgi:hypothetical protein
VKKILVSTVAAAVLLIGFGAASTTFADNNGQAIGKDEIRLALTRCSNAGGGNGGEFEVAVAGRSVLSDCLYKQLGDRYSREEIDAILAQSSCIVVRRSFLCEVDPGNSADHNQAG